MKHSLIALLIAAALLAACAPGPDSPTNSETPSVPAAPDYQPRPDDSTLERGPVYPDSTDLLTMESFPLQFALIIKGNLPTPCHQLRATVGEPDREGKINVDLYSVVDPGKACAEVLQPFEVNIPLGSFPAGHYILSVNGEQVAEFEA